MGVTGFKSLQDKNFKHIAKEIRKKSYLFSIFKKERVKKYAKKEKISCAFACSGSCTDDDGTKNPAFCVDPKLAGPGEIAAGKYDVNGTVN